MTQPNAPAGYLPDPDLEFDERMQIDRFPPLQLPDEDNPLRLEVYEYLGTAYRADQDDLYAAERAYEEHMEACSEYEIDGITPNPAPYCGCSDCFNRATIGFWISFVVRGIRAGRIVIDPPPPDPDPDQGTLF